MNNDHIRRDDVLTDHIADLDRAVVDLTDIEAAPVLNDTPDIQHDLHHHARALRRIADFLFALREDWRR